MRKITDIENKGSQELVNLKKARKGYSLWKRFKNWQNRKDLSGTAKTKSWKILWHEIKASLIYLYRIAKKIFSKIIKGYEPPKFQRSIEGTLPESFSAKELNLKNKKVRSFSILIVFLVLFLLGNFAVLVVNSATLKANVIEDISQGYELLEQGYEQIQAQDLKAARLNFQEASSKFSNAGAEVTQINRGVNLISISPLSTGSNLLDSGENLSKAGQLLLESTEILLASQNINQSLDKFEAAYDALKKADKNLSQVNLEIIPNPYREKIQEARTLLSQIIGQIDIYEEWIPELKDIFGDDLPKRYLIAFLNASESRPCGGFLGSFAIADFDNGALQNLEVQDIYNVDWQLWDSVEAPASLQKFIKTLHMRDSTYLPDFEVCAGQINYFYERAFEGSSLSGVIAIDEHVLEDILKLTGSIKLSDYNLTFNADNFFTLLQVEIESNKAHPETPKQVLVDLVPQVKDALLAVDPSKVLPIIKQWIQNRDLQAMIFDQKSQDLLSQFALTQKLPELDDHQDFLMITDFNIGGNKSDRYISDQIVHRSNLNEEAELYDVLILKRHHSWTYKDAQKAYLQAPSLYSLTRKQQADILFVLGEGTNHNVTEVWVPKGSEIISYEGLSDIGTMERENHTVFYFDWSIPAGTSKEIILKYKLPFQLKKDNFYSLELLKQAGKKAPEFSKEIDLGRNYHFEDGSTWYKDNMQLKEDLLFAKKFSKN